MAIEPWLKDLLERLERAAPHDEVRRERVPQVVEAEGVQLRHLYRRLKRLADRAVRPDAPAGP
jgi:hypothetical protein